MKESIALVLLILANIPAPAHAQNMSLMTKSGVELGIQISKSKYADNVNGDLITSIEGDQPGLTASFTKAFEGHWYISGDVRYAWGEMTYNANGGVGGSKAYNPNQLTELRLVAGQDFDFGSYLLSPYVGFGLRYSLDDLRGLTDTGSTGYRRESAYTYLPLGLTHRFLWGAQSRISASLEYDYFIEGQQKFHYSDVAPSLDDVKDSQDRGYGARLNVAYETADWSAGVFYNYWNIQDLNVDAYGSYQHNIMTREFGIQFKFRFE